MRTHQPTFSASQLESIARALGHTDTGLTGTEIGNILARIGVADCDPNITKWQRLYNALGTRQNVDRSGGRILAFIHAALDPVRYAGNEDIFQIRRHAVNVPLSFYGLEYAEDGKFHRCQPSATLSEAEARASRLRGSLLQRNVEEDVLLFCRSELLVDNYFHAVLEATKSIASKIRERTGLKSDGAQLVQEAFGGAAPKLRINAFSTQMEEGEQRGFVNLLTGFFGTFRNPMAHAARVEWEILEEDALDLLSLASYLLRRIKGASLH